MKIIQRVTGPVSVNTYLVINEQTGECVLVDPGGNAGELEAVMAEEGAQLKAILLTHGHFDHIGACAFFQRKGVPVYIHQSDAGMLCSAANLGAAMGCPVEPLHADFELKGGETLELAGMKFQVLHTPGHTRGGVCYVAERTIFSGDTLFCESVGRTDFPGGSAKELLHSIREKLFSLEGNYRVLPGHEESTDLDWERVRNPYCGEKV